MTWEGDARSLMRANLWLRTASRVLVRVAEFRATTFRDLEKQAKRIEWSRFLTPGTTADFRVTARKSKLYHSDAIAERLANVANEKPGEHAQLFVVRAHRDVFTISADSSGELLHMRGYRQAVAKAPLRETLAAALLLAADWTGDSALLDPFCGSGTIPIEGAMIARRMAPGRAREFAFSRWPGFDAGIWRVLVADADAGIVRAAPPIVGSDRDAGAIESSVANAERAGVADALRFEVAALSRIAAPAASGLIATNPPYGKRVRGSGDVRDLYAQLGNVVRGRFDGWRVAFLSPEERLARQLGLPLETLLRTTNGGLRVSVMRSM